MMAAALIPRSFPPDTWGSASWPSVAERSARTCRFKANPVVALKSIVTWPDPTGSANHD